MSKAPLFLGLTLLYLTLCTSKGQETPTFGNLKNNKCAFEGGFRVCEEDEVCVTWVQTCPSHYNTTLCDPEHTKALTECVKEEQYRASLYTLPGETLRTCDETKNEIFVRGYQTVCAIGPCPELWSYFCYQNPSWNCVSAQPGHERFICVMEEDCSTGENCVAIPRFIQKN